MRHVALFFLSKRQTLQRKPTEPIIVNEIHRVPSVSIGPRMEQKKRKPQMVVVTKPNTVFSVLMRNKSNKNI